MILRKSCLTIRKRVVCLTVPLWRGAFANPPSLHTRNNQVTNGGCCLTSMCNRKTFAEPTFCQYRLLSTRNAVNSVGATTSLYHNTCWHLELAAKDILLISEMPRVHRNIHGRTAAAWDLILFPEWTPHRYYTGETIIIYRTPVNSTILRTTIQRYNLTASSTH